MTPYEVRLSGAARRSLSRLPGRLAHAVIRYVAGPLADNPWRVGKPLGGKFTGYRSSRVGLYRILYWIDEDLHAVLVIRIEHRADVYRQC